ncbi:MAG: hypothetical protein IH999_10425 [Proteobacteria bacterium]|nr:hypothetical protein [Pseudomonadota bacterium]
MPKKNRKSVEPVSLPAAPAHFHWRDGRDYVHEVNERRVAEKTKQYMRQTMAAEYFDDVREGYIREAAIHIAKRESWKAFWDDVWNGKLVLVGYRDTGDGRLWRIPKYVWTDPTAFEDWRKGWLSGCGLDFVNVGVLKPSEAETVHEFCGAKEGQPERPVAARSIEPSDRASKERPRFERRGAPRKYDWDDFMAELARCIHDEGVPAKQAELERKMLQWCENTWDIQPGLSTIRSRINKVYEKLGVGQ